ncbi:hypothetical protein Rsub_03413 [Raphidocelis subcapitata]|uniref:Methyltransferase domain-containing protein n=1 Tax=Raphidocelis subcapitata TaxID=307507 RepID=A0A2V0NZS3_9CHLO|nr:hypothetical protein Rsub_03413 [Raphidocelis subcapitata]|eukprot:GBF90417.1 hypothetical protein Rsub_03413 [Raphidocelis subcapitata]
MQTALANEQLVPGPQEGNQEDDAATADACGQAPGAAAWIAAAPTGGVNATAPRPARRVGDVVAVCGFGRARVASPPAQAGAPFAGRCLVEGVTPSGAPTGRARHQPARLLVVGSTQDYRAAAIAFTQPEDLVLEVGCSYGVTAAALHRRAARLVAVDKSEAAVAEARRRHPGVRFEVADGFDAEALRVLSPQSAGAPEAGAGAAGAAAGEPPAAGAGAAAGGSAAAGGEELERQPEGAPQQGRPPQPQTRSERRGRSRAAARCGAPFTRILVDVGGVAPLPTVLALVALYDREFPTAFKVVKSKYLKTLLDNACTWPAGGADRGGCGGEPRACGSDSPPRAAAAAGQQRDSGGGGDMG